MNTLKYIILTSIIIFQLESYAQARDFDEYGSKNIFAIGYQIGGYSLVGINYEIRLHNYLGVHFGGGFLGYTGGFKIHTSPKRNSSFLNLSFKDGGFGKISTVGGEFGGKWVFNNKNNFGLHYQFGVAKILDIDRQFEYNLYGNKRAPAAILSIGIGFSW